MKTALIPIGNSRGVRIPKPFIEQCGLTEQVEMDVRNCMIRIHAPRQPRAGWADAFEQMAREGDDTLLDEPRQGQTLNLESCGPTRNGPSFYLQNQTGHSSPIARHPAPATPFTSFYPTCGKERCWFYQQIYAFI